MAELKPYIAEGAYAGQKLNIWAKIVFWINVGSGTIAGLDDYGFTFEGRIDTIFYKGDLRIGMELTDRTAGAPNGPCRVTINGSTSDGTYTVEGDTLRLDVSFGAKQQTMRIRRYNVRETEIELTGEYNQSIHLAPA